MLGEIRWVILMAVLALLGFMGANNAHADETCAFRLTPDVTDTAITLNPLEFRGKTTLDGRNFKVFRGNLRIEISASPSLPHPSDLSEPFVVSGTVIARAPQSVDELQTYFEDFVAQGKAWTAANTQRSLKDHYCCFEVSERAPRNAYAVFTIFPQEVSLYEYPANNGRCGIYAMSDIPVIYTHQTSDTGLAYHLSQASLSLTGGPDTPPRASFRIVHPERPGQTVPMAIPLRIEYIDPHTGNGDFD